MLSVISDTMDKLEIFRNEIDSIKDGGIIRLAELAIRNADPHFFIISASSTGKYHPAFDRGLGGLVRHTKCVVQVAKWLSTANQLTELETDILIIASLVHDIKKVNNGFMTDTRHPEKAAEYLRGLTSEQLVSDEVMDEICNCIEAHMGIYGNKHPSTKLEYIMHSADYIASRDSWEGFTFDIDYTPSKKAIKNMPIPFGQYKGMALKSLPLGYLNWIVDKAEKLSPEIKNIVKYYLDNK